MKTKSYIGFFQENKKVQKAANSLKIAGFKASNIFVQDHNTDPLMVCVLVSDQYDLEMAANIFKFHGTNHIIELDNGIENEEDLRKTVSIHSKQQIFSPKENNNQDHYHSGIDSEVSF